MKECKNFVESQIDTPIGAMTVLADREWLYMLEFSNCPQRVEAGRKQLLKKIGQAGGTCQIDTGKSTIVRQTEKELEQYFSGNLTDFNIPVFYGGTEFQNKAWKALQRISYGQTCSYGEQARMIENPKAVRAVGAANAKNHIAVVVPCHRVIGAGGDLTGYGGGAGRKKQLLDLERRVYTKGV